MASGPGSGTLVAVPSAWKGSADPGPDGPNAAGGFAPEPTPLAPLNAIETAPAPVKVNGRLSTKSTLKYWSGETFPTAIQ